VHLQGSENTNEILLKLFIIYVLCLFFLTVLLQLGKDYVLR